MWKHLVEKLGSPLERRCLGLAEKIALDNSKAKAGKTKQHSREKRAFKYAAK